MKAVKPGAIKNVLRVFGKDFTQDFAKGNVVGFKYLLRLSKKKHAKEYFTMADGDFGAFKKMLKADSEEGLNPKSLEYVLKNFKKNKSSAINQAVKYSHLHPSVFDVETKSMREFNRFAEKFSKNFEKYNSVTKKNGFGLSATEFADFMESYSSLEHDNPDLSYFKYVRLSKEGIGRAKLLEEVAISPEDIAGIDDKYHYWFNFSPFYEAMESMKKVFKPEEIKEFVLGDFHSWENVSRVAGYLAEHKVHAPIESMEEYLFEDVVRRSGPVSMESFFDIYSWDTIGADQRKVPIEAIPALRANSVGKDKLDTFFKAVGGPEEYWTKEEDCQRFETMKFLNDYKTFWNEKKAKKKYKAV